MANKYVIRFSKTGYVKYTSHLDLLRMFKRAFKKAELGLASEDGFRAAAFSWLRGTKRAD